MYANTFAAPDRAKLYPSDLPVAAARRDGERLERVDKVLLEGGFAVCGALVGCSPLAAPAGGCSLIPVRFKTSSRLFI